VVADPVPFEEFFERHHRRLYAGLCVVTGSRDEAEERVARMDEPAGYLFRTAMNVSRKRTRRAALAARRAFGLAPMLDVFGQVDDRDVVIRALRDLPPRERAAVVLTALEEYSSSEAGELLGIADSTVRVLVGRARVSMRDAIGSDDR
jgi:RNA polymerase sigma factor (sigma-70 family)